MYSIYMSLTHALIGLSKVNEAANFDKLCSQMSIFYSISYRVDPI